MGNRTTTAPQPSFRLYFFLSSSSCVSKLPSSAQNSRLWGVTQLFVKARKSCSLPAMFCIFNIAHLRAGYKQKSAHLFAKCVNSFAVASFCFAHYQTSVILRLPEKGVIPRPVRTLVVGIPSVTPVIPSIAKQCVGIPFDGTDAFTMGIAAGHKCPSQ